MAFSRDNILNGLCVAGVAVLLLSQTFGSENFIKTEGIHPMDYPRFLICMLLGIAVFIAIKPAGTDNGNSIPIVTRRTVFMSLSFVLYALLFETTGFAVSSFFGILFCALIMGYKRYWLLCGYSVIGCAGIWLLFTYTLKIQLPAGTIW